MTKHEAWLKWLEEEQKKEYFQRILGQVRKLERDTLLYPEREDWFRPLSFSNIEQVKVVITETRPSVEPYAADGLAWSSLDLPSHAMQVMYRKLYNELGVTYNQLDHTKDRWAEQGILLLPIELTATSNPIRAQSVWEEFTFSVIEVLMQSKQTRFFLFLDDQHEWRALNNPHHHPTLSATIYDNTPIFSPVDNFVTSHYGVTIDWR